MKLALAVLLSALGLLAVTRFVTARDPEPSIELLCANKATRLEHKDDLLRLATQFRETPEIDCAPRIRKAILELVALLSLPHKELCSVEIAERIRDFHLEYLEANEFRPKKDQVKDEQSLPKSLVKFSLAFGMQVSNICERLMAESMSTKHFAVREADADLLVENAFMEHSAFYEITRGLLYPAEIALPADFASLVSVKVPLEKIYIQTNRANVIRNAKNVCEKRFQPLYEPIILPTTILSSVGYNYQDKDLATLFKNKEFQERAQVWSDIVFLCEGMKLVEPLDLPIEEVESVPGRQAYRIVSKEEASEIEQKLSSGGHSLATDDLERFVPDTNKLHSSISMRNLILDPNNSRLNSALSSYRTMRTSLTRVRSRVMRQALERFSLTLKSGRVLVVLSPDMKAVWRSLTGDQSQSDEEVKLSLMKELTSMRQNARELEKKKTLLCFFKPGDLSRYLD